MKTVLAVLAATLCLSPVCAHADQSDDISQQARAALNSQEAAEGRAQLEQNAANLQAWHMAWAARAAEIRRQQQDHEAAMANYNALIERYEHDVRVWHDMNNS